MFKGILRGKKCDLLGFGISNAPLAELLAEAGAEVTVRDEKAIPGEAELVRKGIRIITGEGYLNDISADFLFRSPGIRPDAGEIPAAVARGAVLTGETELFLDITPAYAVGITGSDGKTTTTTLTHFFFKKAFEGTGKKAYVGGNIGTPLLPVVGEMTENDVAVVELSSFQLMGGGKSPRRAAITNITPNHLNWHKDYAEYIEAKKNIFTRGAELLVTNADNEITAGIAKNCGIDTILFSSAKKTFDEFSEFFPAGRKNRAVFLREGAICVSDGDKTEKLLDAADIILPGRHNIENYMTAIGLTLGLVTATVYPDVAKTFGGVEHRLEFVREFEGVKYYNSSIDSTPTRTAAALSALTKKPVIICGGYDKKIPFEPLAESLCRSAKAVVLTGATAGKIKKAIEECPEFPSSGLAVFEAAGFEDAVISAKNAACPGDIVLLSPACASFDAFRNFEERGRRFKEIVLSFKN